MSSVNSSLPNIWVIPTPPAPQQETVVNNDVNAPIDQNVKTDPYDFLISQSAETQITQDSPIVHPVTDGAPEFTATGASGGPSDLGAYANVLPADLDPKVFENWSSTQQSEYLNYVANTANNAASDYLAQLNAQLGTSYTSIAQMTSDIGSLSGSTPPPITAVLSVSVPGKVYIVNSLQKTDFASMSLADQQAIAATAYFQNTLAGQLGLSTDATSVLNNIQTEISLIQGQQSAPVVTTTTAPATIGGGPPQTTTVTSPDGSVTTTAITYSISGPPTYHVQQTTTVSTTRNITTIQTPSGPVQVTGMPTADKAAFIGELALLQSEVGSQAVVSPTDIANQVKAITDRFTRAAAFWPQVTPTTSTDPTTGLTAGYVSEDDNATIQNGYSTFIQQEEQVYSVEKNDYQVAMTGTIGASTNGIISSVQADAPTLVAYYQMDATTEQESIIAADTAEVQQINALLQTYSDMQNLVQKCLKQFQSSDTSSTQRSLSGATGSTPLNGTPPPLTPEEILVASMFSHSDQSQTGAANLASVPHPLEVLFGITRPTQPIFSTDPTNPLNSFTQNQWNAFATQLSNTVTQLQQQSQVLTDQINEETKQKDDHFSLGNDAMSKMYDMVQEIGRGL